MEVEGVVAFSNLSQHEVFNGKSIGKYSLVLVLDDSTKDKLSSQGVKIKDYQGKHQRKFTTQYPFKLNGTLVEKADQEIRWGTKVKLNVTLKNPSPVWGMASYFNEVTVLEEPAPQEETEGEF